MPPPRTASNSGRPVVMRGTRAGSIAPSGIGPAVLARETARAVVRPPATENGRSSKVFQAAHCGQRPSQRVDSKPHPEQKKTARAFAIRRGLAPDGFAAWLASLLPRAPGHVGVRAAVHVVGGAERYDA